MDGNWGERGGKEKRMRQVEFTTWERNGVQWKEEMR